MKTKKKCGILNLKKTIKRDRKIIKTENKKLKYFNTLEKDLTLMTYLKDNAEMYPPNIVKTFGYDNETIFSYKVVFDNIFDQQQ